MKARILIADHDEARLLLARRFFSSCGFEVRTATEGLACLVELRRSPPDALVLDFDLPWGGADGVLAQMVTDPRLRNTPIVIARSRRRTEAVTHSAERPAVEFISKPYRLQTLLEAVSAAQERAEAENAATV